MDKQCTKLMEIFKKEYEKKQKEIDKLDSDIEKLEMKKKKIIFETMKKAMKMLED